MAAPSASLIPRLAGRVATPWTISWLERATAGAAIVCLAPVVATAGAVVCALSGDTPFVLHSRVGQHGQTLWVPKLRTMWRQRQRWSGRFVEYLHVAPVPVQKDQPDPRVTSRFASFCRRHSIDELPQVLLVLSGKLRFVGPRPVTQAELDDYYGVAQHEVLQSVPGLTGLWQVMGRNRLTYAQRRRLDLFFVRRQSPKLCAWILLRTLKELLSPRAAW